MKKIFISGNPGTGKTTLVKRVVEEFGKENFFGFWTEEIRENKRRMGFKIVTTWNAEKVLARVGIRTDYRVGKYFVIKENLDEISRYMLNKLDDNKDKIIVIDEIGKMEWYSKYFRDLVKRVLEGDYNLIAVVHRTFVHMVPYYYWLDIGKWWEIYEKVKRDIKEAIK